MKSKLRLLAGIFAAALATATASLASRASEDAENEINRILQEQVTAWNRGDAEIYGAHFANDCTFTVPTGGVFKDKAVFVARHAELFGTIFKGSKATRTTRRFYMPAENVVAVDLDAEVTAYRSLPPGIALPPDGILRTRMLEVFLKHDGKWEVIAYHVVDLKPNQPSDSKSMAGTVPQNNPSTAENFSSPGYGML